MNRISQWIIIVGVNLLMFAFYYDCAVAGGFSWDDPPELTAPYEREIEIADSIYRSAYLVLGSGILLGLILGTRTLARRACARVEADDCQ